MTKLDLRLLFKVVRVLDAHFRDRNDNEELFRIITQNDPTQKQLCI